MDLYALATLCIFALFSCWNAIHVVPEGHRGFFYSLGALQPPSTIAFPGLTFKLPYVTVAQNVQVTQQVDKVENIACGTSGGTMIRFQSIEVVNQLDEDLAWEVVKNFTAEYDKPLIFDKMHHEVNQICSEWTLEEVYTTKFGELDELLMKRIGGRGVIIKAVRVTKPILPPELMQQFEKIEKEKAAFSVAIETQRLVQKEAETERKRALIDAQAAHEAARRRQRGGGGDGGGRRARRRARGGAGGHG